ncbi:MAG: gliding motility-associated C-terminal domain-containing protein [Saprospiraceae bacterium]|nr:gliding motility-associated C-terminal domain-containing protein [Saprospiraceae bacterium]MCB9342596.1 gliding motility-associated C-terminal domain-containing protein [Lewinellaceae bacterium]
MKQSFLLAFLLVCLYNAGNCQISQTPKAAKNAGILKTCTTDCLGTLGENIFPNGDFGTGIPNILPTDPLLAPGYIYQLNPPPNDGYYSITNNTSPWGWFASTFWINIEDNGPEDNGYMMVVNASYPPGLFFLKTVDICENTYYELSLDVINLIKAPVQNFIKPNLSFLIDGTVVCETGDIPQDEQWHTIKFSFISSPGQTSAILGMRNNAPGGGGNDLAIDNITFRACSSTIEVSGTVPFCAGTSVEIDPGIKNLPSSTPVFQWQIFEGGSWIDIVGETDSILTLQSPNDSTLVRLLMANQAGNLNTPNCRVASETILLQQQPGIQLQMLSEEPSCHGMNNGSSLVTPSSGSAPFTYEWNTGNTTAGLFNLGSGNYQVTVTDVHGCTGMDSIVISEPPGLLTQTNIQTISCFGAHDGSAEVAITGGTPPFTYSWENGESSTLISGLVAADYQVTILDANGCMVVDTLSVTQPPEFASSITQTNVSCYAGNDGQAVIMSSGGTPPYQYLWNTGDVQSQLSNVPSGAYQVTITDSNSCLILDSVFILEPSALQSNITHINISCFEAEDGSANVIVTGGTAPYTYHWDTGSNNDQMWNAGPGTHSVMIEDANGCIQFDSVKINEPPPLIFDSTVADASCNGSQDGSAIVHTSGGTSPYVFAWENGASDSLQSNIASGTYPVTVTDAHGCSIAEVIVVGEPSTLQSIIEGVDITCFGGLDGYVSISASGGVSPYHYLWSTGEQTDQVYQLAVGNYQVTVEDVNGCLSMQSVVLSEPPPLVTTMNSEAVSCFGGGDGQAALSASGGIAPYSFVWNNGSSNQTAQNLTAGTYAVTVFDSHNCSTTNSVVVTQATALQGNSSVTDVSCYEGQDGSAELSISGGIPPYVYDWSNGSTGENASGLAIGNYAITVHDDHGCLLELSTQINQPPPILPDIQESEISCFGYSDGSLKVSASGGVGPYDYVWNTGDQVDGIFGLLAGYYSVSITDSHGCIDSISHQLINPEIPEVVVDGNLQLQLGEYLELTAHTSIPPYQVLDYTWFGSTDSLSCANCDHYSFQPIVPGCQEVLVRSIKGCVFRDSICYQIIRKRNLYAPNVFSPNGDGINDFFTLFSDASVDEIVSLSVYNRWGGHIYKAEHIKTNDEYAGWDGTFKNKDLNPDVFVWMAEVLFIDGVTEIFSGDVTLVR